MFSTIKSRILVLVCILVTVSVGATLVSSILIIDDSNRKMLERNMEQSQNLIRTLLETSKMGVATEVKELAMLPIIRATTESKDKATINDMAQAYKEKLSLAIFDVYSGDGENNITATAEKDKNENKNLKYMIQRAKEGETSSGIILFGQKNLAIVAVAPIGIFPEMTGFLVIGHFLDDTFAKRAEDLTGAKILFKTHVAENIPAPHDSKSLGTGFLTQAMTLEGSAGESPGEILIGFSLRSMQQTKNNISRFVLGVGIVILFISFICSVLVANSLSNPIIGLKVFTEEIISQNDLSKRIMTWGKDEIFYLGEAFNRLLADLQSKRRDLQKANQNLEQKVTERTLELREAQKAALENARSAGMAEIATEVLHNVGNILNSVNISIERIRHVVDEASYQHLNEANKLLLTHSSDLAHFLSVDPKGRLLPEYYLELGKVLGEDFTIIKSEALELAKRIQVIKDVIASQQTHAKGADLNEEVSLAEVVEAALALQTESLTRNDVKVVKAFFDTPKVLIQRAKLTHVVVNIVKNAKESMIQCKLEERILKVEVGGNLSEAFVKITDNGKGIEPHHLQKIFSHGFTTKKEGHGFGLHSCANALTEMGGKIDVVSQGLGRGATFTISLKTAQQNQLRVA